MSIDILTVSNFPNKCFTISVPTLKLRPITVLRDLGEVNSNRRPNELIGLPYFQPKEVSLSMCSGRSSTFSENIESEFFLCSSEDGIREPE